MRLPRWIELADKADQAIAHAGYVGWGDDLGRAIDARDVERAHKTLVRLRFELEAYDAGLEAGFLLRGKAGSLAAEKPLRDKLTKTHEAIVACIEAAEVCWGVWMKGANGS
jgi:hypothetical protein